MAFRPLAPPVEGDLDGRRLHEVVRDWPETLEPLRRTGLDVAAVGGRPLGVLDDAAGLRRVILEVTAWRR